MEKIRIGNDITVEWTILRNGQAEDLKGRDLQLLLKSPWGKVFRPEFSIEDGNRLRFSFLGKDQQETGEYSLVLIENAGKAGMYTVDACKVFCLVAHSCTAGGGSVPGLQVETVRPISFIAVPSHGLSAYEIAVKHGYEGTEEDWIEGVSNGGGGFTWKDWI